MQCKHAVRQSVACLGRFAVLCCNYRVTVVSTTQACYTLVVREKNTFLIVVKRSPYGNPAVVPTRVETLYTARNTCFRVSRCENAVL